MASDSGSQEPRTSPHSVWRTQLSEIVERNRGVLDRLAEGPREGLTREESDHIADGEPYCFRCGKPASSFSDYDMYVSEGEDGGPATRADAVRNEEGTYNPDTNRFACDACYIAIGMPTAPEGWKAP